MLNRIILMGRLVADPELRQTTSGVSVASFRIAVDRNFQTRGAERQTDFIPCVAWRQTGEFISRYFQKGSMIAVEGSLQSRSYEDRTGAKRTAYEVVVDQAHFTGSRAESGTNSANSGIPFPTEPPQFNEPQRGSSLSVGDFGSFEEIDTDDGDLPF